MSVAKIVPPPRCADCKCRTERVLTELVAIGQWRELFLCASCEYLRGHPDAAPAIPAPRSMRAAKLQSETLFDGVA